MSKKIFLFSMPRSGSTYTAASFINYYKKTIPNFNQVSSEFLNTNIWKNEKIYNNVINNVSIFLNQKNIKSKDIYVKPDKQLFKLLCTHNSYIYKYFPFFNNIITTQEMIDISNENKVTNIFLYRKSIIDTIISHIYLAKSNKLVLWKDSDEILDISNFDIDLNKIDVVLNDYQGLYQIYQKLQSKKFKIFEYEKLTFDPKTDFHLKIESPTRKIVSVNIKENILKTIPLFDIVSSKIKNYNIPENNLEFLIP